MQPALSGIAPIAIVKNFNHRLPMCLSYSLYCLCSVLLSRNLVIIIKWCLCNLPLLCAVHLSKIHTSSNHRLPVTSMFPSYIHTSNYHTICLWLVCFHPIIQSPHTLPVTGSLHPIYIQTPHTLPVTGVFLSCIQSPHTLAVTSVFFACDW